jgi:hypothetical protein
MIKGCYGSDFTFAEPTYLYCGVGIDWVHALRSGKWSFVECLGSMEARVRGIWI